MKLRWLNGPTVVDVTGTSLAQGEKKPTHFTRFPPQRGRSETKKTKEEIEIATLKVLTKSERIGEGRSDK